MTHNDNVIKTLGYYRDMWAFLRDENDPAVKFLDAKIAKQGRDEPVLAHETQMLILLEQLSKGSRS